MVRSVIYYGFLSRHCVAVYLPLSLMCAYLHISTFVVLSVRKVYHKQNGQFREALFSKPNSNGQNLIGNQEKPPTYNIAIFCDNEPCAYGILSSV